MRKSSELARRIFWNTYSSMSLAREIPEIYHPERRVAAILEETSVQLSKLRGPKNAPPKLSVVIPAYNEEAALLFCLSSIAGNQGKIPPTEVIVVDNSSSDCTGLIAEIAGATTVVEPKKGVGVARQRGLKQAEGELVLYTDADCMVSSKWLTIICQFYENNPGVEAAFGNVILTSERGYNLSLEIYNFARLLVHSLKTNLLKRAVVGGLNFSGRKLALNGVGGFNERLRFAEDTDIARKFANHDTLAKITNDDATVIASARRPIAHGIWQQGIKSLTMHVAEFFGRDIRSEVYEDIRT